MLDKILFRYSIVLLMIFIINVLFLGNVLYVFMFYVIIYLKYYKHRSKVEKIVFKVLTKDAKIMLFCGIYILALFITLVGIMIGVEWWFEIIDAINSTLNIQLQLSTKWLNFINIIGAVALVTFIVNISKDELKEIKSFIISVEVAVGLILIFIWEYIYKINIMKHFNINLVLFTLLLCLLAYSFESLKRVLRKQLINDLNKDEYKELVEELNILVSKINNLGIGTILEDEFPWHLKYMLKTDLISVKDYIDKKNIDKYTKLNYKMNSDVIEVLNKINIDKS